MENRVKKLLFVYAAVLAVLSLYAFVFFSTGVGLPCVFHLVTGLNCPGCGISRAIRYMSELRFADALKVNLMAPLELVYIIYCIVYVSTKYVRTGKPDLLVKPEWLNIAVLSVIAVWWVARNIIGI